jgi:drug/metabolite transporter (DMT)-like permease
VLIKFSSWDGQAVAGGRSFITAVTIAIFFALRGSTKPLPWFSKTVLFGSLWYFGTVYFFAVANKLTTAANAILLQYTAPVYIIWFNWLIRGSRPSRFDLGTVLLVISGIALFLSDGIAASGGLGNILALLSGVMFALLLMTTRKAGTSESSLFILLGNILAAIAGASALAAADYNNFDVLLICFMGVFQLALPYILVVYAMPQVSALEAVLVMSLEPILNPIWVGLVHEEIPGGTSLAGGALVFVAVTTHAIYSAKKSSADSDGGTG